MSFNEKVLFSSSTPVLFVSILPHLQIELIDASDKFLNSLKGVTDPEQKRKIIGNLFIESFVQATEELKSKYSNGSLNDAFLLQGTLYPDVIESVSFKGPSHTIKTHHNVGGLPEVLGLELLEPLRELFKGTCYVKLSPDLELSSHLIFRF